MTPPPSQKGLNLNKFKDSSVGGSFPNQKSSASATKDKRIKDIMKNIDNLPSLPTVVLHIMRLANDPTSSMDDFEEHIRTDQVLTAKILKIVNSSFYGLSTTVNSISRAIVVLGLKTLRSVVLAASTSDLMNRDLKVYGYVDSGLWLHSIITAGISRHLALNVFNLGMEDSEEAFIAGLLHDIGKVAISPSISLMQDDLDGYFAKNSDRFLIQVENGLLGINHAETGAIMLERWKLSNRLVDAIRSHHDLKSPENDELFNNIIMLADYLSSSETVGHMEDYPWKNNISIARIKSLNMTKSLFKDIQSQVKSLIEEMQPILDSLCKE